MESFKMRREKEGNVSETSLNLSFFSNLLQEGRKCCFLLTYIVGLLHFSLKDIACLQSKDIKKAPLWAPLTLYYIKFWNVWPFFITRHFLPSSPRFSFIIEHIFFMFWRSKLKFLPRVLLCCAFSPKVFLFSLLTLWVFL